MPVKRKTADDGDQVSKKPRSKSSKKTRVESEDESAEERVEDSGSEAESPPTAAKKSAKSKKASADSGTKTKAKTKTEDSDETVFDLGKNKRVTVKNFKGNTLIDIREFYVDKTSGDVKPGKKGVSLTPEQWQELKQFTKEIDTAVADIEK
ncbi:PC4-domain-containing protein [Favolaschia claudopus]|uniref:PC4-domain-containing protein n=1 Tax=Favolaschia claudopus TaxID=2862362 RepID=A0AAW0E0T5_9AGAR